MKKISTEFHRFITQLELYESPCSYFKDRNASQYIFSSELYDLYPYHDYLFASGFRRSGCYYYRSYCPECLECLSYRIDLAKFTPDKNQIRVSRKNRGVYYHISEPDISVQKEQMYVSYQRSRHKIHSAQYSDTQLIDVMKDQMYNNPPSTFEMEFYKNDALYGFMIVDKGVESVSAVYSVFDTNEIKNSPGKFMVLSLIDWGKEERLKYLYLGYMIKGIDNMSYKKNYQPGEYLVATADQWQAVSEKHQEQTNE